jgi:hypothetical protein
LDRNFPAQFGRLRKRSAAPPAIPHSLAEAFAKLRVKETARAVAMFREGLCEYVDELRKAGFTVIEMILTVKDIIRDMPPHLLERAVQWSVERYTIAEPA